MGAEERTIGRRQGIAGKLELHPEKQCPLRARDQAAEIERLLGVRIENIRVHQKIEGVAGISSRYTPFRKVLPDKPPVLGIRKQVTALPVNSPLQRVEGGFAFLLELCTIQRAEDHLRSVAQKSSRGDEMFPRRAINE